MLTPRAIAMQGVGFTPLLMAVQGLWPESATVQPAPQPHGSSGLRGGRRRRRFTIPPDLDLPDELPQPYFHLPTLAPDELPRRRSKGRRRREELLLIALGGIKR